MQRSLEEPIQLEEDSRSLAGVFLLAIIGSLIGVLAWWMQAPATHPVAQPSMQVKPSLDRAKPAIKPSTVVTPAAPPSASKAPKVIAPPSTQEAPVLKPPKVKMQRTPQKPKPRTLRARSKPVKPKLRRPTKKPRSVAVPVKKATANPVRQIPKSPSKKEVEIQEL